MISSGNFTSPILVSMPAFTDSKIDASFLLAIEILCFPLLFFCELVFVHFNSLIIDPASLCSCALDLCEYQHDEQRPRAMRGSRTMENKCVLYDVNAILWPSRYILLGASWNSCMVSMGRA